MKEHSKICPKWMQKCLNCDTVFLNGEEHDCFESLKQKLNHTYNQK